MPPPTPGRAVLTLSSIGLIAGAFLADFSETHLLNPKWPPHARFHNGQTMSMGAALGLLTMYYTWRSYTNKECERQGTVTAMLMGSLYWMTGFSAILYPGTLAVDPEFRHQHNSDFPQKWIFAGLWALTLAGGALELRRLGVKVQNKRL